MALGARDEAAFARPLLRADRQLELLRQAAGAEEVQRRAVLGKRADRAVDARAPAVEVDCAGLQHATAGGAGRAFGPASRRRSGRRPCAAPAAAPPRPGRAASRCLPCRGPSSRRRRWREADRRTGHLDRRAGDDGAQLFGHFARAGRSVCGRRTASSGPHGAAARDRSCAAAPRSGGRPWRARHRRPRFLAIRRRRRDRRSRARCS